MQSRKKLAASIGILGDILTCTYQGSSTDPHKQTKQSTWYTYIYYPHPHFYTPLMAILESAWKAAIPIPSLSLYHWELCSSLEYSSTSWSSIANARTVLTLLRASSATPVAIATYRETHINKVYNIVVNNIRGRMFSDSNDASTQSIEREESTLGIDFGHNAIVLVHPLDVLMHNYAG